MRIVARGVLLEFVEFERVTETPAASAALLAVQFKFGLGLGTRGFNVMVYLALIASLGEDTAGEATGSLVGLGSCLEQLGDFSIVGSVETQLTPLITIKGPAAVLYDKRYQQKFC